MGRVTPPEPQQGFGVVYDTEGSRCKVNSQPKPGGRITRADSYFNFSFPSPSLLSFSSSLQDFPCPEFPKAHSRTARPGNAAQQYYAPPKSVSVAYGLLLQKKEEFSGFTLRVIDNLVLEPAWASRSAWLHIQVHYFN